MIERKKEKAWSWPCQVFIFFSTHFDSSAICLLDSCVLSLLKSFKKIEAFDCLYLYNSKVFRSRRSAYWSRDGFFDRNLFEFQLFLSVVKQYLLKPDQKARGIRIAFYPSLHIIGSPLLRLVIRDFMYVFWTTTK